MLLADCLQGPDRLSLGVVAGILAVAIVASLWFPEEVEQHFAGQARPAAIGRRGADRRTDRADPGGERDAEAQCHADDVEPRGGSQGNP